MSLGSAADAIHKAAADAATNVGAFRATVTAVSGPLVSIRREGEATGSSEFYPSVSRSLLYVGDVVLCIPIGGKPVVVDVIRRAAFASATYTVLGNAGTGATASIAGDDTSGTITVVTGTSTASGTFVEIDFAAPRPNTSYSVELTRGDLVAGSIDVRHTGKTVNRFRLYSPAALNASTTYVWDYHVRQYG
jgi:hypothetical protein